MPLKHKIFINCPFDNQYFPLLKTLLFTIVYLDYIPKISETSDSGVTRLQKLAEFIKESSLSIHDISRSEPLNSGDLPRFNMPFECGMDFGGLYLTENSKKKFLILDGKKFRYQKVMSDIAGNDIKIHDNKPEKMVKVIRDWLCSVTGTYDKPHAREIVQRYMEFEYFYQSTLQDAGLDPNDIESISFSNYTYYVEKFLED